MLTKANAGVVGGQSPQPHESIDQPIPLAVRRVSSHERHPKQRITFSDLPAEIRNLIWNAALAPRLIVLDLKDRTTETESPTNIDFNNIPGMLFANRESRTIALHHCNQKFTVSITKSVRIWPDGCKPERWNSHVMCRIPVIMSAVDEIAFSASQFLSHTRDDHLAVSIDAPAGAPEPYIQRISMLNDNLMRRGIDTEHLARLLNPSCPEWDASESTNYGRGTKTMTWKPLHQWPKLSLSEKHLEQWETLRLEIEGSSLVNADRWLRSGFAWWYKGVDLDLSMGRGVGAWVFDFALPDEPGDVW